jgi:hypothetical protein
MEIETDLEGINAAKAVGAIGKDPDRKDSTTGGSDYEQAARKKLDTPSAKGTIPPPSSALRQREDPPTQGPEPAFRIRFLSEDEETMRRNFKRGAAEDERRNAPDPPDTRSALRERKDARRQP